MFLTWDWHLDLYLDIVTGPSLFQILALYIDFESANNIHVLKVLCLGFEGHWRFLTWVWQLHLDLNLVTCLQYTHDQNFGSLS